MRKPFIAGNWKMNMTSSEVYSFMPQLADALQTALEDKLSLVDIAVAPSFLSLEAARKLDGGFIHIMAQNVSQFAKGAYTGEVSLAMLRDIGIAATIIGHSERRQYFKETDESVAAKTKEAIAQGFLAVACIGETLAEREAGQVKDVITRQVNAILKALGSFTEQLILAYEPVWAIGTGKTASKDQAAEVHRLIRKLVEESWGAEAGQKTRILYGGSVKADNAHELLSDPDIDGALVGGASLNIDEFTAIAQAACS